MASLKFADAWELVTRIAEGRVRCADIHHVRWLLQRAEVDLKELDPLLIPVLTGE